MDYVWYMILAMFSYDILKCIIGAFIKTCAQFALKKYIKKKEEDIYHSWSVDEDVQD